MSIYDVLMYFSCHENVFLLLFYAKEMLKKLSKQLSGIRLQSWKMGCRKVENLTLH